jgi:hypothetical protein
MRLQGETRGYFLFRVGVLVKPHHLPFPHVSRFLGRGGFCPDAKTRHSWHDIKTPTCVGKASANINTNLRTEQGSITVDKGLFEFYKDYFDGIRSFEK